MDSKDERNGLREIIGKALEEMRAEAGGALAPEDVNLAEFCRRTGLTRSKARTIKSRGFKALPHGRMGVRAKTTVMTGFTDTVDALLVKGVTNSEVIYDRIAAVGCTGGRTTVRDYISSHRDLVPAKRGLAVASQGSRGTRFRTGPGEAFQMDWGFANVEDWTGVACRLACFAMVCHHCGTPYVELFPNARQESPFIGMVRAFLAMGVPGEVLTDSMKSVVIRCDVDGRPVWQADCSEFMSYVGFRTRPCEPRHPFTKGKVLYAA